MQKIIWQKIIWIDITDPKYAMFFSYFIPKFESFAKVIVTTRYSKAYCECKNILDSLNIKYFLVGDYGGGRKEDKFISRINRELGFLELFKKSGKPDLFICGASVEGVECAFALGIKIAIFADTPVFFKYQMQDVGIDSKNILKSKNNLEKNIESKNAINFKTSKNTFQNTKNLKNIMRKISKNGSLKNTYYKKMIKHYKLGSWQYTILSRLCFTLADIIFYPFVLPKKCFKICDFDNLDFKKTLQFQKNIENYKNKEDEKKSCISHSKNRKKLISYPFIDVALWLDFKNQDLKDFTKVLGAEKKFNILVREEEFLAHYVGFKNSIIYDSLRLILNEIDCNIFIMPRYGKEHLKEFENHKNIFILDSIFAPCDFYPFVHCMIGGGGTMNLEAAFLGVHIISARSIFLYHDLYLLKNNLMKRANSADEVLYFVKQIYKKYKKDLHKIRTTNANKRFFMPFCNKHLNLQDSVNEIIAHCQNLLQ